MEEHQHVDLDGCLSNHGVHIEDGFTVCWNKDTTEHPLNWKPISKYYSATIVIWLEFYMTVLSSSGVRGLLRTSTTANMGQAATAKTSMNEFGISRLLGVFAFITM